MAQGVEVKVSFLHLKAKTPVRRHDTDAGWDIFSINGVELRPRENKKSERVCVLKFRGGTIRANCGALGSEST